MIKVGFIGLTHLGIVTSIAFSKKILTYFMTKM